MANALLGAGQTAPPLAARVGRRWLGACVLAGVGVALFFAYLGLSRTYPENSDEANILLMAHDMLHGNLLLRHWYTSDVPFITTELPQIAVLVGIFGLHLNTAHIAAAMTYALVVLIGVLLARGPWNVVPPREGLARMLLAGGIMFAPQTGIAVFVLILSVGHIGTAIPVMLAWLVVDRLGARRYVPVAVALLLAWGEVADPLVLVLAVVPLALVCLVRLVAWLIHGDAGSSGSFAGRLRELPVRRWFELSLGAAAGAGYLLAWELSRVITNAGGYVQNPVPYVLDPARKWYLHGRVSLHGLLSMFGAYFVGQHGLNAVLAVLHIVGVVLVVWAAISVARRFLSWPSDMISQVLLVAIVANLAAYIPSHLAAASAVNSREFAPVLPFAAVIAGRQLGGRLVAAAPRIPVLVPALAIVLAGYTWTLVAGAVQPPAPAPYADVAAWMESHGLRYGLGGYWQASVITVETGGKVTIRAVGSIGVATGPGQVTTCTIVPYSWEVNQTWFDPARHRADFILLNEDPKSYPYDPLGAFNVAGGALLTLGRSRSYSQYFIGNAVPLKYPPYRTTYIVRVYKINLLSRLPVIAPPQACEPTGG
jgi:hypothetical protein